MTKFNTIMEKLPCVAGSYCAGGAAGVTGTGQCPIGKYCPTGSITGLPCPPKKACEQLG